MGNDGSEVDGSEVHSEGRLEAQDDCSSEGGDGDEGEGEDRGSAHEVDSSSEGSPTIASRFHDRVREFPKMVQTLTDASSMLELPDAAKGQVCTLLRAIADKYLPAEPFATIIIRSESGKPASDAGNGWLSMVGNGDYLNEAGSAQQSARVSPQQERAPRASGGPGTEGADASMQAYAQWLAAELAADDAEDAATAEVDEEPDMAGDDDDAVELAGVGFNPIVPVVIGAALPVRDTNASSKPRGKKKANGGGGSARAPPAPSQISVIIRCAVLVGKEVWLVARDTGSIAIHDAASAAPKENILVMHHLIMSLAAAKRAGKAHTVWAGTDSGTVLLYDGGSRLLLKEVARPHAGAVQCIAVQRAMAGRSARLVVTGGSDRRLCVWEQETLTRAFQGHTGAVRCALVLGAHIWSGSDDATVRVWDMCACRFNLAQAEACVATLRSEGTGAVRALVATGGLHVITCSEDGSVCKWQGAPHFACVLRVSCAGSPSAIVPMGRRLWVCCGRAGIEVRDALTLELRETLRSKQGVGSGGLGAVGALRVQSVERRVAWTWVPGECGAVWEREEREVTLSPEDYAAAIGEAESLQAQLDVYCDELAALRRTTRNDALRALAVKAALAHELEGALALDASKARELDELTCDFMAQQSADLEEQRELQALCEQLEAANARQEALHRLALEEAALREEALRRELFEARGELDQSNRELSDAYCERDMLRLGQSHLELELHDTLRRQNESGAFGSVAASTGGGAVWGDGVLAEGGNPSSSRIAEGASGE